MRLIEEKRLRELLKNENILNLLEDYGVDNWEGYYSWDDEEELDGKELDEIVETYEKPEMENN